MGQGLRQEVLEELRYLLARHRVRLLAGLAYTVLLAGALYLFSAVGEDSRTAFDVHRRSTLAVVGTGLLAAGVLLALLGLLATRLAARRAVPGREPGVLPQVRPLLGAALAGSLGVGLGVLATSRWG